MSSNGVYMSSLGRKALSHEVPGDGDLTCVQRRDLLEDCGGHIYVAESDLCFDRAKLRK
jgi:hypothetical protein